MKLAEALLLRADLQKKHQSLRERVVANAVVQQGDAPHEAPDKLLKEAFGVLAQLEELIARIHATNMKVKLKDGRTLTEAIARRDTLIAEHALITAAIAGCRKEPDRYSAREIKWVATLDVAKLQKQSDDLAKKIRELNVLVQDANWKAVLAG
jgi:Family of unknown function (DUF6847)